MASKKSSKTTKTASNTISCTKSYSSEAVVLAVDVGVKGAIGVLHHGEKTTALASFTDDMKTTLSMFMAILHDAEVEAVVILDSFTRHMKVATRHHQHYGIIVAVCQLHDVPVYFVSDVSARKKVLGSAPRKREEAKAAVMAYYENPNISQDEADVMLALDWYTLSKVQ